jgi:hypothetical protein
LSLDHDRALTVLAQARRIDRDDGAQRISFEEIRRVVAERGAVAQVDPAEIDDRILRHWPLR